MPRQKQQGTVDRMKYVAMHTPPKSWGWGENGTARPTDIVIEADPTPVHTGLLDANGVPIYRVQERGRLGFEGKLA